jgi:hypothetical protein
MGKYSFILCHPLKTKGINYICGHNNQLATLTLHNLLDVPLYSHAPMRKFSCPSRSISTSLEWGPSPLSACSSRPLATRYSPLYTSTSEILLSLQYFCISNTTFPHFPLHANRTILKFWIMVKYWVCISTWTIFI